ncbi:MAG: recombinase zinc beta ribbon domain-containing protein [Myxococcales bacterium]|nr:recombinase zinc beta ribbon domain-containing protein [Myxococcales bacterium]
MRCGHCGRRMYVNYGGERAVRTLQYRCSRPLAAVAGQDCQLIGGKRIEALVVEAFLDVSAAAGIEAAALAGETLRLEIEATERSWHLQIEKAEYEAQRAERQYLAVEPENRTVARELERRWNERLVELEALRAQAARTRRTQRPLSDEELARAQELGKDLHEVWSAPSTTVRDRKRLLRALIEEVQVKSDENFTCCASCGREVRLRIVTSSVTAQRVLMHTPPLRRSSSWCANWRRSSTTCRSPASSTGKGTRAAWDAPSRSRASCRFVAVTRSRSVQLPKPRDEREGPLHRRSSRARARRLNAHHPSLAPRRHAVGAASHRKGSLADRAHRRRSTSPDQRLRAGELGRASEGGTPPWPGKGRSLPIWSSRASSGRSALSCATASAGESTFLPQITRPKPTSLTECATVRKGTVVCPHARLPAPCVS